MGEHEGMGIQHSKLPTPHTRNIVGFTVVIIESSEHMYAACIRNEYYAGIRTLNPELGPAGSPNAVSIP